MRGSFVERTIYMVLGRTESIHICFSRVGIVMITNKKVSYKNTATAIVVVQRPFLSPSADWQTFWVLMILPLAL